MSNALIRSLRADSTGHWALMPFVELARVSKPAPWGASLSRCSGEVLPQAPTAGGPLEQRGRRNARQQHSVQEHQRDLEAAVGQKWLVGELLQCISVGARHGRNISSSRPLFRQAHPAAALSAPDSQSGSAIRQHAVHAA
jgi:hypothetical protein